MPERVYIFGYSGHSYVIIETLQALGIEIGGYFDKQEAGTNPYDLSYMGFEKEAGVKKIVGNDFVFPAIGDNRQRAVLVHFFEMLELRQFSIVDPTAKVSSSAVIAHSTYVARNACINARAMIGKGVIVNTGAIIEHECTIGDFSHVAPGGVLCGNVFLGTCTFFGASAVAKQGIMIEKDAVVGAGSVVLRNIPTGEVWVGNPAKKYLHE